MVSSPAASRSSTAPSAVARPTRSSRCEHCELSGQQLPAVVAGNGHVEDEAGLHRAFEADQRETFGAAERVRLGEHAAPGADLLAQVLRERRLALLAHAP